MQVNDLTTTNGGLTTQLANEIGLTADHLIRQLKLQLFRDCTASNEALATVVAISAVYQVNPLLPGAFEIWEDTGGRVIVQPSDSLVSHIIATHPGYEDQGHEFVWSENGPQPEWQCDYWIRISGQTFRYTAFQSEWDRGGKTNWARQPRHMLMIKAKRICARMCGIILPLHERQEATQAMPTARETNRPQGVEGLDALLANNDRNETTDNDTTTEDDNG
jgi:hypothetical protein